MELHMKTKRSIGSVAALTAGLVALLVSASASANGVYWSVGVSSPGAHVGVQNVPPVVYHPPVVVYQQPQVVYQQPQVVYHQPQVVYVQPRPVYVQPQPIYFTRPAPVYYGAPQVHYNGWQQPRHPGWHRGHGHGNHREGPRVAVRISGHTDDRGRNHH